LSAVAVKYNEIKAMDVEILSVSTQTVVLFIKYGRKKNCLKWRRRSAISYALRRGGKIGKIYGIYDEAGGVDIRGRFIIDPDGVIQAMEVLTPSVGRNVSE
jgi:peroxiredoxin (alkyl hydroperoxide reductase subunit C)